MRISFASLDGIHIDEHFGWCKKFYMYEIDAQSYNFVKELDASMELDGEVDRLEYKIECLENSDIICVSQIGPKAANMVQASGIYPMKSEKITIEDFLQKLQKMIQGNPPLWLKRILVR